MSALTDFMRQCHEPQVDALQTRIADLEAKLAERVKVKPLEWREEISETWWTAESYRIETFDGGGFAARVAHSQSRSFRTIAHGVTFETAKAAAQADFDRRILSALEATPPARADDDGSMTPEEIRLENLKQMASYSGPVVSFDVRDPYYLASCNHCGWVGSTELCGTDSYGDDSDVYCPRCHASGADSGKVASRIATPPAPKVTAGEWREVQTTHSLKGRRRSPAYFPATGETCEVSGPNCDDADGYTWGETTVLWQNELFVLYGRSGFWPVLHKHEHILFRPLTAAQEAGKP